jgi:hypothetical protein
VRSEIPASLPIPGSTLDAIERWAVLETLRRVGGNKSAAAKLLGIDRRTLYRKLALYQRTGEQIPNLNRIDPIGIDDVEADVSAIETEQPRVSIASADEGAEVLTITIRAPRRSA